MNRTVRSVSLACLMLLLATTSLAQMIISGTVVDSSSMTPLQGANIFVETTGSGTISNINGYFVLETEDRSGTLKISLIGFKTKTLGIIASSGEMIDLGIVYLNPDIYALNEIRIMAASAIDRKSPVSATSIKAKTIDRELGDRPYPSIMQKAPGVYATRTGGGSGDASVNIRGFKQENVALMLNGIPINSVENGLVYWNNWIGLTEVTRELQVQRGIGVSNVAMNSIGGTINIITKTTETEKGGSFKHEFSSYGNYKATLSYSTGKLKSGLAVTLLASRFAGPGYVDATYADGWAYFLSLSKNFGNDHKLVFTALGNPERHGQRNFRLSQNEIDRYGIRYNRDWGSYNGKINNASENFYHKPHFSLNHYWNISPKTFLATSGYFSFGYGGGKWTDTFGGNPWIFSYYNPSGQIDWPGIYEINANNEEVYSLANGKDTTGYSINIQTNFLASHVWSGLLSTVHHEFNDRFKLIAGIHGRYFKSKLQQKVRDLLGGDFYIDDFAFAVDGVAGREQIKHVGDVVKVDNGALVNFVSGFAQGEYTTEMVSAFVAGTINHTWYRRDDRYNYVNDIYSPVISKPGFDLKAGVNINLNEYNNIFLNTGYFSTAPYFKFVFGNFNNIPTRDLNNEKALAFELGYGLNYRNTAIRFSVYNTRWIDKSILTNEYNQFEDPAMVQGLDALHRGIEFEIQQRIGEVFNIGGMASVGDWKWQNDVTAFLYSIENVVVDTIDVYANGLYVGDAPQLQLGLNASLKVLGLFNISAEWFYNDRMYADFNPANRTDPGDRSQSFRLPAYQLLNAHIGFPFSIGTIDLYASGSVFNLLDEEYIVRAEDGPGHDLESMRGFWGFGRNFNFGIKLFF
jgi:hypothetical protein